MNAWWNRAAFTKWNTTRLLKKWNCGVHRQVDRTGLIAAILSEVTWIQKLCFCDDSLYFCVANMSRTFHYVIRGNHLLTWALGWILICCVLSWLHVWICAPMHRSPLHAPSARSVWLFPPQAFTWLHHYKNHLILPNSIHSCLDMLLPMCWSGFVGPGAYAVQGNPFEKEDELMAVNANWHIRNQLQMRTFTPKEERSHNQV